MHTGQLFASLILMTCIVACSSPTASPPDEPAASTTGFGAATDPEVVGSATSPSATPVASSPAPSAANPDAPPQRVIRVISWNIHHGEGTDQRIDLDRIAAWLRSMQPDVVFLQEVDRLTKRSGNVDQAATLAQQLGMWSAFGAFMPFDGGEYGMAVLSRFELADVRNIALPPGKQEPRTSVAATIHAFGGPPIRLFDVHLDWLQDDSDRYAQAQALLHEISADVARMGTAPAIIAGDFNDQPGSRTISLVQGQLAEADKSGTPHTWPSDNPSQEIDFVFVLPAKRLVAQPAVALDAGQASDHKPVFATILTW